MASLTYTQNFSKPGIYYFNVPSGFEANLEIHVWGAGGGSTTYAKGGGGGYAKSEVSVSAGDLITVAVGSAGGDASGMTVGLRGESLNDSNIFRGQGGFGGSAKDEDNDTGAGAGGGGATVVIVNSTVVAVGAGGGGAGGQSDDGTNAQSGLAGGDYQLLNTSDRGANGGNGGSGGGGGGGGYPYGGAGGLAGGDDNNTGGFGGNGGQNYGNVTLAGSGIVSGGQGTVYDPTGDTGYAGYNGYAVIIFTRKFQAYQKDSSIWKKIINAFYKQGGTWKTISQIYVKQSGSWNPLLSTEVPVVSGPNPPAARGPLEIVVTANVSNYVLYGIVSGSENYVPGITDVNVTILSNVVISSTSSILPSFTIGGFTTGDTITITNNGIITGAGGKGADQGSSGTAGTAGGTAVKVQNYTKIINNGTIQGGGGGGGGYGIGGSYTSGDWVGGGGGGGGAGLVAGQPGTSRGGSGATAGNLTAGGLGGTGLGFKGGNGGAPGQPGQNANGNGIGQGGRGGYYVEGNSYVIWDTLGTVAGTTAP